MLTALKSFLRKRKLKQIKKADIRSSENQLHSIGILFDAEDLKHRDVVVKYIEALKKKGKKVKAMAFIGELQDNNSMLFDTYNEKEINWIGVPSHDKVGNFAEHEFDVLFNFFQEIPEHVAFIVQASRAKLKIGIPEDNDIHDLTIESKNKFNLAAFIKESNLILEKLSGSYVKS